MARIVISGLTAGERDAIKGACAGRGEYVKDVGKRLFLAWIREGDEIGGLRGLLWSVEWVLTDGGLYRCPKCCGWKSAGHFDDCALAAALRESTP